MHQIIGKPIILLGIIGVIGFFIRIYYFPYGIVLSADALGYFSYAYDMSRLGSFPSDHPIVNNGWPSFLSIFFSFYSSTNFIDYMNLQRYLTVTISVLTIIPIYLLCLRFFPQRYSLIGPLLFVFHPLIIQNSFFGIAEPAFILLGTTALFLFTSNSSRSIMASFGVTALFSLVRYEGILLFFVLSIIFFIRRGKGKNTIFQYILCVSVFLLIILPMTYIRLDTLGYDGIISHTIAGPQAIQKHLILGVPHPEHPEWDDDNALLYFVIKGLSNLIWYLGIVSIPSFIFLIPASIFIISKNNDFRQIGSTKKLLILFTIAFMIPAFYIYARGIQEPRYLLILIPMFSILSVYFFKNIKIDLRKPIPFFSILIIVVLISSVFLEYEKVDYEHQREALAIAEDVVSIVDGSNDNGMDGSVKFFEILKRGYTSVTAVESLKISRISTNNFDTLHEFLKESKDMGLTHIVIDGKDNRPAFLNDIFYNDSKYPYLNKVYDSHDYGYRYHVKVYQINYELFNSL